MTIFKKRPIKVEAVQWMGDNLPEICFFTGLSIIATKKNQFTIETLEGKMLASLGDYIVKEPFDKERGFYPCKPEIFFLTYEKQNKFDTFNKWLYFASYVCLTFNVWTLATRPIDLIWYIIIAVSTFMIISLSLAAE